MVGTGFRRGLCRRHKITGEERNHVEKGNRRSRVESRIRRGRAVKEQCSGLYAQELAQRGFLTIAFDPSFTGESGGSPRRMASPDINTEDFQAAVDFLSTHPDVDPDKIGIVGICGWGGMALNAAALDTRVKATVAVTMYDMSRVNANGYNDSGDNEKIAL